MTRESTPKGAPLAVAANTKYATTGDLPLLARRADYALRVVSVRRDGHLLTRFYATLADVEHLLAEVGGEGK